MNYGNKYFKICSLKTYIFQDLTIEYKLSDIKSYYYLKLKEPSPKMHLIILWYKMFCAVMYLYMQLWQKIDPKH